MGYRRRLGADQAAQLTIDDFCAFRCAHAAPSTITMASSLGRSRSIWISWSLEFIKGSLWISDWRWLDGWPVPCFGPGTVFSSFGCGVACAPPVRMGLLGEHAAPDH